jgi:hypothetical protein
MSNDRKDIIEEQLLRENIRKALSIVEKRINAKESIVRNLIGRLLREAAEVKYDYTSLNLLAHFVKEAVGDPSKPDSNQAFKQAYTDLSSNKQDREMFVEFILDLAKEDFQTLDAGEEPLDLNKDFVEKGFEAGEEEEEETVEPKDTFMKVSVQDLEDADGDVAMEPEEEEDEAEFTLGEDAVNEAENDNDEIKKYAREAYKRIGPPLRRYYGQVQKDNTIDEEITIDGKSYGPGEMTEGELFKVFFEKNLKLWADRYEDIFFDNTPDSDFEPGEEEPTEEPIGDEEPVSDEDLDAETFEF